MPDFATNLRRLMARFGLTVDQVVQQSGLDERTVKGILNHSIGKPHARTLHRLASGLGVSTDELFQNPSVLAHRLFDRRTNPVVEQVTLDYPHLFESWREDDFDELYSHFGSGGALTTEGAMRIVREMNHRRAIHDKVAVILQSGQCEVLASVVDAFYRSVIVSADEPQEAPHSSAARNA